MVNDELGLLLETLSAVDDADDLSNSRWISLFASLRSSFRLNTCISKHRSDGSYGLHVVEAHVIWSNKEANRQTNKTTKALRFSFIFINPTIKTKNKA